jgi:hypothetical protein
MRIFIISLSVFLALSGATPEAINTQMFDEFGAIDCESEKARLDALAIKVLNDPESQLYFIGYGGRNDTRCAEVMMRLYRMKKYLVDVRGMQAERFVIIDGGYRENLMIQLWIKSREGKAPVPTPTVLPKDVRFKKGKIKRWEYDCSECC